MDSLCEHFGTCGGCAEQHKTYSEQIAFKESVVKLCLQECIEDCTIIDPIISCESIWEWRNKMEFSFGQNKEGSLFLGLHQGKKRGKVFNIHQCLISPPWMTLVLEEVRRWWQETGLKAYFPPKDVGTLRTLTLREGKRTQDRLVILTISGNPAFSLNELEIQSFQERVQNVLNQKKIGSDSILIVKQITQKKIPTRFEERLLSGSGAIFEWMESCQQKKLFFKIRSNSFFQPNPLQAEKLYRRAMEIANIQKEDIVFDLYCGTGSLSLFASEYAQHVIGIEMNPSAVQDAQENIERSGITNVEIFLGDVGAVLEQHRFPNPDLIMVDPPRAGLMPNALRELKKLHPRKILYISCNPKTQAENIKELMEFGYRCIHIQPIDQFPHTLHIENIALLQN